MLSARAAEAEGGKVARSSFENFGWRAVFWTVTGAALLATILLTTSLKDMLARHPERVIETAVKGMLPKNPLGRAMYSKLKVYKGPNHPHSAQQPQALDI